jgi:hypothetical protein
MQCQKKDTGLFQVHLIIFDLFFPRRLLWMRLLCTGSFLIIAVSYVRDLAFLQIALPARALQDNHKAGNRTAMNDGISYDMDDAVAAMQVLHAALTFDLEELEKKILALGHSISAVPMSGNQEVSEYYEARTALLGGLSSIAEVLAWIEWKTEEDPEGDVAVAIQPLPTLRGCSIH